MHYRMTGLAIIDVDRVGCACARACARVRVCVCAYRSMDTAAMDAAEGLDELRALVADAASLFSDASAHQASTRRSTIVVRAMSHVQTLAGRHGGSGATLAVSSAGLMARAGGGGDTSPRDHALLPAVSTPQWGDVPDMTAHARSRGWAAGAAAAAASPLFPLVTSPDHGDAGLVAPSASGGGCGCGGDGGASPTPPPSRENAEAYAARARALRRAWGTLPAPSAAPAAGEAGDGGARAAATAASAATPDARDIEIAALRAEVADLRRDVATLTAALASAGTARPPLRAPTTTLQPTASHPSPPLGPVRSPGPPPPASPPPRAQPQQLAMLQELRTALALGHGAREPSRADAAHVQAQAQQLFDLRRAIAVGSQPHSVPQQQQMLQELHEQLHQHPRDPLEALHTSSVRDDTLHDLRRASAVGALSDLEGGGRESFASDGSDTGCYYAADQRALARRRSTTAARVDAAAQPAALSGALRHCLVRCACGGSSAVCVCATRW